MPCLLTPAGEQIWVRRDIHNRGGLFSYRELALWFAVFIMSCSLLLSSFATFKLTQMDDFRIALIAIFFFIVTLIPLNLAACLLSISILTLSRYCPTWLYAEQLNPEQLKVYHFRKPPTIIKLASSTLNPKTKFKHYTTLSITDKDTRTTATLDLLTPEEYNRFMQYWNAANPRDA